MIKILFSSKDNQAELMQHWVVDHTNPPYYWVKTQSGIIGVYFREDSDYLAYKMTFEI